ncbi:MAG: HYR domain-containing protein [Chitinophagaceae bacterium]
MDACGRTVSAVLVGSSTPPSCNGSVVWTYRYTACDGTTTADWTYTYIISHTTPPSQSGGPVSNSSTVECATSATAPAILPVVKDVCGNTLSPAGVPTMGGSYTNCEGTITYTYHYQDCSGLGFDWTYTYNVDHTTAPSQSGGPVSDQSTVECPATAIAPATLPIVKDVCGNTLSPVGVPTMGGSYTSCEGTITYTYHYEDCSGLGFNWTYTYTIDHVTPPAVPDDGEATVECVSAAIATGAPATVTDVCGNLLTGILTNTINNINPTSQEGTRTYVYTFTDCSGLATNWQFVYTIDDNTAPTYTGCPSSTTINTGAGRTTCDKDYTWTAPVPNDNCSAVTTTWTITGTTTGSGSGLLNNYTFNKGLSTVTYTFKDAAGNPSTCSFSVTVVDNTAPMINNLPASFTVNNLANNCLAMVTWVAPTATDNCAMQSLSSSDASYNQFGFTLLPVGVTTITYTATDASGNITTQSFTVTVKDVQPPTITGCPGNISVSSTTNTCGAQVIYQQPNATDNCGGLGVTMQINNPAYLPGSVFPVGVSTVTWTATDAANNTATCTFTVTVTDGTPPVITCPANISSGNDPGLCSALLTITPATAIDNCSATVMVEGVRSDALALNQPFPAGITTITWTATDLSNNSSTCTQTVTVTDTQKPTLTCPANIMAGSGSNICGAVINYPAAIVSDNCTASNLVNVVYSMPSGSTFPLGTTTVTVTATDAANNSSSCTFTVTVTDQTAPVVTCPATVNVSNTTGFCGAFVTYPAATATDNCTPSGAILITYSQASGTFFPVGTTPVTVTAADANGNSSTCTFNVVVADAQAPSITCPANVITNNDLDQCGAVVNFAANATDNCPGTVISYSKNPNTLFPIGTTTVTVTATDAANNTSTCTFDVTVNDIQVPVITCKPDIIVNAPVGQCSALVTIVNATATDNCVPFVGKFRSDGLLITAPYPVGTTTITWFALDAASNQATCTQKIIVKDATPPSITCPATVIVNNTVGQCGASVNPGTPTVTDDCSSATYAGVRSDFLALNAIYPVGTTIITWTATDGSGNTASCTQAVTVIDAQDPVITCNPSINTTNDPNQCGASLTINAPGATDNCPGVTVTGVRDDSQPLGALYPIGQTVITWTAKDAANRTASCTQTVTVTDIQSPIITCPPNLTVNADAGQCSAVVGYTAQVSDNCPGTTLSFSPISGSSFPIGTTTVIATATDAAGNTAICAFTVTVVDNIPPTITCPANISVFNTPNTCGAAVNFPAATVSDNCSGVTTTYSPASGSIFPIGTTTVTATAKDASNNTSTCTFTVTVVDNQTPTISCPGNQSAIAEPGVCGANVTFLLTIGDNCPGLLTINQSHQSGQFFPVGVTTVTVTATDLSNNTATCTFTVTVTDGQAPNLVDPADITLPVLTGCSRVISLTPPTATDNCGINGAGVTGSNIPVGNIFPVGTTVVTWSVTDVNGNSSSVTQSVTVADQLAPVPNVAILSPVTGTCTATVSTTPTATDNCEGLITATTTDPTTYNTPGTHTITWTYTDSKGNSSTQTQSVIVNADGGVINTQPVSAAACVGETATFTISATGGLQWQLNTGSGWNNLGGATTSSLQLLNVTAAMNGYQYRVIANGSCGNTISEVATLTVNTPPVAFAMTGGGSYCSGPGVNVGLASSQIGVNYQLIKDGSTPVGAALAGNGQPLGFGFQPNGTYTVKATNAITGCENNMAGNATVTTGAPPTAFSVTGGGSYCSGPGVSVGISGSQSGVNYVLVRNGTTSVGLPFPGTGLAMDLGLQTDGVYTVMATNTTTGCTNNMAGSATVSGGALPTAFSVTGGGYYCGAVGAGVGLAGSQTGVNYQLMRNGSIPVGSAVAGTNAAIGFGSQTADGVYTVVATNATTGCTNSMTSSANVQGGLPPTAFSVTGGGNYCGAVGVAVGLSGSQSGVNYQLFRGSTPVGSPVAGTNAAISFGNQNTAGTYTVVATNASTGCTNNMTASASVTGGTLPTAYIVTGGGNYCSGPGVAVGLSGSQTGINYQLFRGATSVGSPVAGTNAAISFGNQNTAGTYTVVATNASTGCTNNMTGSAAVTGGTLPTAFSVTGGGGYCSGAGLAIGLSGSQSGVNYQLFRGGSTPVGGPVAGTNAAINFGNQTILATYTVVATNTSTGCTNNMTGNAVIGSGTLPSTFNMTGGGGYCGGTGLAVGLSGSQSGVNYQLKRAGVNVGSPVAGTGSALAFTPQTVLGTYTVTATNASTGCTAPMASSAIINSGTLPNLFTVTVVGTGYSCASTVHLSGSQTGVKYQLKVGAANVGSPVAGTGSAINFGSQSVAGYYSVVATTQTGGCSRTMTGTPTITAAHPPTAYNVIGGGAACSPPGVSVGLAGSQSGVSYQLRKNGSATGSPVTGTGVSISFGLQAPPVNSNTGADVYTVIATNTSTGCSNTMNGQATISKSVFPNVYNVSGGGTYCTGGTPLSVKLSSSQTLVRYQLLRNGSAAGLPAIVGTGALISFNNLTLAGTYTIQAEHTQIAGCTISMSGSASISCTATRSATPTEPVITKGIKPSLNITIAAFPNPSEGHFNVTVSSPVKETVEVRMFDMQGRVIEIRRGAPDQTFRFGDAAAAGMYIIEARQSGIEGKAQIKVIKAN